MKEVLIVSIGSFFGGGMRYWISKLVQSCTVIAFPFGTMAVNVAGCLIIGFLSGLNWREGGMDVTICQTAAHHGILRRIHYLLYLYERGSRTDEGGELCLYDALSLRKSGAGTYRRSRRTLSGENDCMRRSRRIEEKRLRLPKNILKIVFHQMKK